MPSDGCYSAEDVSRFFDSRRVEEQRERLMLLWFEDICAYDDMEELFCLHS
jgi:hypothetical protein